MKVRTIMITVAAAAVLAAPGAAMAQGQGGIGGGGFGDPGIHGGGGRGGMAGFGGPDGHGLRRFERMLPRLAERLELNEGQVEAIQEIIDKASSDIQNQLDLMRDAVGDVEPGSFHGENFDADDFRVHLNTTSPFKIEIQVIAAGAMNQIMFDVLDEDQRGTLEGLRRGKGRRGTRGSDGRAGAGS